ncbi:MAG TPA: GTPase [Candidatus Acidoferrales bacterium]
MPANLTPEYLHAEKRFKAAQTGSEKLDALEEMLATIPKHKGTEKMQADIKRRMAKVRGELQHKGGPARGAAVPHIEKQGAGQVVLIGAPNTGKSLLVRKLTHATPEVAEYPFTTRLPCPGMMPFEDIQIQLVDLPPVHPQSLESWLPQVIRYADAALLVVDLGAPDLLDEIETTVGQLEKSRILLRHQPLLDRPAGLPAGTATPAGCIALPTLLVANKRDMPGAGENASALEELYRGRFPMISVSADSGEGLEDLKRAIFTRLDILRVYTKAPGKKADYTAPYVLKRGATVVTLAERVHKDLAQSFRYARVWGHGKFEGQMVQRDYALVDRDVIELHC